MKAMALQLRVPAPTIGIRSLGAALARPARLSVPIAVGWSMLLAATTIGLRVPSTESVTGVDTPSALDYSTAPGPLTPLSENYIRRVLGPNGITGAHDGGPTGRTGQGSTRDSSTPAPPFVRPTDRRVVDHTLTNDDAEQAFRVTSLPFSARTDTRNATRAADEPQDCEPLGGTVWYRYTPPLNIGLTANTFGTNHAVTIGVFTRNAGRWTLASDKCDRDSSGNAVVTVPTTRGITYWFQVTSGGSGGDIRFNLDPRGNMKLASATPSGRSANRPSNTRSGNASPDGRFITFQSAANNLTPAGTQYSCAPGPPSEDNYAWVDTGPKGKRSVFVFGYDDDGACSQVYVRDRLERTTTLVSASRGGIAGNSWSVSPFVSGDGRFVVFTSDASNLGPDEPIGADLFLREMRTGALDVIATTGPRTSHTHYEQNFAGTWLPSVTDDGRFVAFQTPIALRPDQDTNGIWDVYVFDRVARTYELATVNSNEQAAGPVPQGWWDESTNGSSGMIDLTPFIAPDGRYVVFRSPSPNLVNDDTNGTWDTFLRDRVLGTTERVSVPNAGQEFGPTMPRYWYVSSPLSADGRYVVFDAYATGPTRTDPSTRNAVYVRDRFAGTTKRIQVGSDNNVPHAPHYPSISRNGRFVTYTSWDIETEYTECKGNAIDNDVRECFGDVLVYDMKTDTTFPITVSATGRRTFPGFGAPTVSDDGTIVAFQSYFGGRGRQVWYYEAFPVTAAALRATRTASFNFTFVPGSSDPRDECIFNQQADAPDSMVCFVVGGSPTIHLSVLHEAWDDPGFSYYYTDPEGNFLGERLLILDAAPYYCGTREFTLNPPPDAVNLYVTVNPCRSQDQGTSRGTLTATFYD